MKKIDTLIRDINKTLKGMGGWDGIRGQSLGYGISLIANQRFSKPQEPRGYLSLSSVGTPCKRKLWYKINRTDEGEELTPNTFLKFFYGDMIEELVLQLAIASGHDVTGEQDRLDVHGVKGHRDAVIDGMTVDVKSCSSYAYKKFKEGKLKDDDPFGYVSQLSSYVYAGKDDPLVTDKTHGAFLAVDKQNGNVCLDVYDFSEELDNKEAEILDVKNTVEGDIPEEKIDPVPQSKTSDNMKLSMQCSYCEFKYVCWKDIRTFIYSYGPEYLTEVNTEPKVPEIFHD
mgnify:CR=1 FL=1